MGNLLSAVGSSSTPALVWHGHGERIELSHRVMSNWFTKCANALINEAGFGPGMVLAIDLPTHWRTVAWAGAAQLVGAEVLWQTPDIPAPVADAVVTTNPDHPGDLLILTPLASLARSLDVPLPSGAIDGASDVMTQPDEPMFTPHPLPPNEAKDPSETKDSSEALHPADHPASVLIADPIPSIAIPAALQALIRGQHVVLVGDGDADLAAIAAQEGVAR